MNQKLIGILKTEQFDIVQLESLFVAPYLETIRKYSKAKVVLRSHNVEFEIWHRRSLACKNPLKKAYLTLLTSRLKNYEVQHVNKYDAIACITTRDQNKMKELGGTLPMTDIPVGVDEIKDPIVETAAPIGLFHLGSMDWMPNLEAIEWFLNDIWDDVKKELPDIKLNLAGKSMPQWLMNTTDPNIETVGHIKDAKTYMNENGIMIVPLLSGSGMRVKIIEGMALGKVIISTAIGAEGIEYEHGKDIFIADTPGEFVQAITKCYGDIELCKTVGRNAKELVRNKYDNIVISQKLIEFYRSLS
ncbi:MAG: glycosyltransferase family 4 protein [Flavobacteriales bacterium]|nr:glycosyltransferase family 4 protein [Flavobacteriales bacterium]